MQFINGIWVFFFADLPLFEITPEEWGTERHFELSLFNRNELVSKSPMAGRKGYTSGWDPHYGPQVVNVMLCFNDFMDKELICVLFPIAVLWLTLINKRKYVLIFNKVQVLIPAVYLSFISRVQAMAQLKKQDKFYYFCSPLHKYRLYSLIAYHHYHPFP